MSDQDVLRPFPGMVVDPEWVDRVISGPYDAYTPAQRVAMAAENPYSFLHVTRSQEDLPPEQRDDIDGLIGYCADSMHRLYDAGVYRCHDEPVLFLYRMGIDTPDGRHVQTGIMGLVPVTEDGDRRILRHEAVRPGRTDLLARHLLTVGASSSPISLTFRSDDGLEAVIARCCEQQPVLDSHHEGVDQTVWAVGGLDAAALIDAFGRRTLYVTDGHHRLAAAIDARSRVPDRPDDGPLEWIQAVLFADEQLLVLPFHRRVGDQAGRNADELVDALGASGTLTPAGGAEAAPVIYDTESTPIDVHSSFNTLPNGQNMAAIDPTTLAASASNASTTPTAAGLLGAATGAADNSGVTNGQLAGTVYFRYEIFSEPSASWGKSGTQFGILTGYLN